MTRAEACAAQAHLFQSESSIVVKTALLVKEFNLQSLAIGLVQSGLDDSVAMTSLKNKFVNAGSSNFACLDFTHYGSFSRCALVGVQ